MKNNKKDRKSSTKTPSIIKIRFRTPYELCNYYCEYCIIRGYKKDIVKWLKNHLLRPKSLYHWFRGYLGHRFDLIKRPSWDEAKFLKIIDAISSMPYRVNVRIAIGGEFFLNKTLVEGARILSNSKNCVALNLITNLSFPFESYEKFFEEFDLNKVALVASYHPTQIKDKEKWLTTAEKMNKLVDFTVVVLTWPPLIDKLSGIKSMFAERNIPVFLQAFNGYYNGKKYPGSYTSKEREILRNLFHSRHDYEHMVNLKKPGICYAGVDYINIDMNGDIFPCQDIEKPLGNVLSGNYRLLRKPIECPAQFCWCDTENMNTKQFRENYQTIGINQHKYTYKNQELAKKNPAFSEWNIQY